jgi:dTDP-4-dehydrorhamnose reductase
MRVLVTGGYGLLGTAVCTCFGLLGHRVLALGSADSDITNHSTSRASILGFKPDIVIHAAAMTDVDGCERDPDAAYRVNSVGAWNIAASCEEAGARIVFISTDFVFDGKKTTPYTEFDETNPINVYGKSKLIAEKLVKDACQRSYIVRTSWLFGPTGKCFPKTILNLAKTKQTIDVVSDQVGSPTYVDDLALTIADIVQVPMFGTYHVANGGECTWHEFAETIITEAEVQGVVVNPILAADWPSPATRPAYSALRSYGRELQGKPANRHWRLALKEFVSRGIPDLRL